MLRSAKWRSTPATEGQKAVIRKRLHLDEFDLPSGFSNPTSSMASIGSGRAEKPIDMVNLTKGEAANILTRVFHGAMKRYTEKVKRQNKAEDVERKRLKKQEMQTVRVGPLPV